jgi:Spy/CpxP family protein refolding chaperone
MKRNVGIVLMIVSVGLNVAFVATWLVHRLPERGGGCHEDLDSCPMHVRLGATEPQWREIEAKLVAFRESSKPLCRTIDGHRLALLNLVSAPSPDLAAIRAKQQQILEGQRQMQENVIENLMQLSATLTPEQRRRLFDLLRERSRCGDNGPMTMGMGGVR